jgi:hypothetical protein
MLSNRILIILATAFAFGCSESANAPTAQSDGPALEASIGSPIIHQVSAGGPDVCSGVGDKPGCDANFSLVAIQRADGSVTGQWVDRASRVNGGPKSAGVFVVVNCLNVVGNQAWVSGVATGGPFVGQAFIVRVQDNPDQISPSFFLGGGGCLDAPDLPLFDAPQGQVVVK